MRHPSANTRMRQLVVLARQRHTVRQRKESCALAEPATSYSKSITRSAQIKPLPRLANETFACIDPGFDYQPFGFTGHRASAEVVQEFPERVAAGPAHLRAPPRPRTAKYSSRRQSARIRTLRRFASQDGTTGPDSLGVGYATDREDL